MRMTKTVFVGCRLLKEIISAGAPLGASLQIEIREKLYAARNKAGQKSNVVLSSQWGMSELSGAVRLHRQLHLIFQGITFALQVDPVIDGAIGSPFPGCDVRLIDDHGNDVPVDTPGELLFRGNPKTNNNCSRTHRDEGIF